LAAARPSSPLRHVFKKKKKKKKRGYRVCSSGYDGMDTSYKKDCSMAQRVAAARGWLLRVFT
jgi:hypothetical protein